MVQSQGYVGSPSRTCKAVEAWRGPEHAPPCVRGERPPASWLGWKVACQQQAASRSSSGQIIYGRGDAATEKGLTRGGSVRAADPGEDSETHGRPDMTASQRPHQDLHLLGSHLWTPATLNLHFRHEHRETVITHPAGSPRPSTTASFPSPTPRPNRLVKAALLTPSPGLRCPPNAGPAG